MSSKDIDSSRRDFIRLAAAGSLPVLLGMGGVMAQPAWPATGTTGGGGPSPGTAATRGGSRSTVIAGVRIGVQTYSFRDMLETPGDMTDKMIHAMQDLGLAECEVFEPTLQPPEDSAATSWRTQGGKVSPASLAGHPPTKPPTAAQLANREAIRQWRLGPALDQFHTAAAKFQHAGIRVLAFNYTLKDDCTDEEILRGFELTRALGTDVMTASTTLTMAKRTVPLAEKHHMLLSLHGHSNLSDPNQFATPQSFMEGLALSPNYRVNLDIGHFAAAGFDPVAFIRDHHTRITHLHVKDRKKDDGPNVPFGQGDTPIKPVLQLLKKERYPIPAYIEYEYAGTDTSTQEVRKCLDYVKEALA